MKYSVSVLSALLFAVVFGSVAAFTPPAGLDAGVYGTVAFVKVYRVEQIRNVKSIEIRCELMTDDDQNWVKGIKMVRDGDYFVYDFRSFPGNEKLKLEFGDEVRLCFVLGTGLYMPDCFHKKAAWLAAGKEWVDPNTEVSNGQEGGRNFAFRNVKKD